MSVMSVDLTRAELVSLKETLEVTPRFEGRAIVRDAVQAVLRERRSKPAPLRVEESALSELARRIVVIDLASATIRSKLDRELKRGRALVETTP
jgi:hypothetical protein